MILRLADSLKNESAQRPRSGELSFFKLVAVASSLQSPIHRPGVTPGSRRIGACGAARVASPSLALATPQAEWTDWKLKARSGKRSLRTFDFESGNAFKLQSAKL